MCNRGWRTAWFVLRRRQLPAARPSRPSPRGGLPRVVALMSSAPDADGVPAPRRGLTAIILRPGAKTGRLVRLAPRGPAAFSGEERGPPSRPRYDRPVEPRLSPVTLGG